MEEQTEHLEQGRNVMKLGNFTLSGSVIAGSLSILITGLHPAGAGEFDSIEPVNLRVGAFNSQTSGLGMVLQQFTDDVTARTDGKVKFEIFWSGSLMPPGELLTGIGSGLADLGFIPAVYTPQKLPVTNWASVLQTHITDPYPLGYMETMASAQEFARFPEIVADFEANDVVTLAGFSAPRYTLQCAQPFTTLAEIKGKRVRSAGEPWNGELKALEMVPVSVPVNEQYDALQKGVIDCVSVPPISIVERGLWEVAKYVIEIPLSYYNGTLFGIGKDKWDSLPDPVKKVLRDSASEMTARAIANDLETLRRWGVEGPQDHQLEFVPAPEIASAVEAYRTTVLAGVAETAPSQLADPKALDERYAASVRKWSSIFKDELGIVPNEKASFAEVLATASEGIDFTKLSERISQELSK
jgi:TRAP-type C4-dicarboxylate transport system substrate-binding protein